MTESDSENYQSVSRQTHYDITDKYRTMANLKVEADILPSNTVCGMRHTDVIVMLACLFSSSCLTVITLYVKQYNT